MDGPTLGDARPVRDVLHAGGGDHRVPNGHQKVLEVQDRDDCFRDPRAQLRRDGILVRRAPLPLGPVCMRQQLRAQHGDAGAQHDHERPRHPPEPRDGVGQREDARADVGADDMGDAGVPAGVPLVGGPQAARGAPREHGVAAAGDPLDERGAAAAVHAQGILGQVGGCRGARGGGGVAGAAGRRWGGAGDSEGRVGGRGVGGHVGECGGGVATRKGRVRSHCLSAAGAVRGRRRSDRWTQRELRAG